MSQTSVLRLLQLSGHRYVSRVLATQPEFLTSCLRGHYFGRHDTQIRQHNTNSTSGSNAEPLRTTLLDAALKHVPERGWTASSLVTAARDLQLSPAILGLLPRGEGELVEHWMELANKRCLAQLEERKSELEALPLEERVTAALRMRLELIHPVIDTWPQALAVAAKPANAPHSLSLLLQMVDELWYAVGDTSTDASWYSKRAILAGVYTTTSLYMLTDYSPGYADTWQALRRRVSEGLAVEGGLEGLLAAGQRISRSPLYDARHQEQGQQGQGQGQQQDGQQGRGPEQREVQGAQGRGYAGGVEQGAEQGGGRGQEEEEQAEGAQEGESGGPLRGGQQQQQQASRAEGRGQG